MRPIKFKAWGFAKPKLHIERFKIEFKGKTIGYIKNLLVKIARQVIAEMYTECRWCGGLFNRGEIKWHDLSVIKDMSYVAARGYCCRNCEYGFLQNGYKNESP